MKFNLPLSILFAAGLVITGFGSIKPASAGWWDWVPVQHENVKLSELQQIDLETFCRNKEPYYRKAERDGDGLNCHIDRPSEDIGINIWNGQQAGLSLKNGTTYSPGVSRYTLTEVCDKKHPFTGAFVGDGGWACYDSRVKF